MELLIGEPRRRAKGAITKIRQKTPNDRMPGIARFQTFLKRDCGDCADPRIIIEGHLSSNVNVRPTGKSFCLRSDSGPREASGIHPNRERDGACV
jgi:hypothetical protein